MTNPTCPKCGITLAPGTPEDLCPGCLLRAGLGVESRGDPGTVTRADTRPPEEPARSPEESVADHFPDLEILGVLGQGGMGVVYKARQKQLDRLVALKVLNAELAGRPGFVERFQREARALARLSHPNIVSIHDFGQRDGRCYLVMEFVDGLNLRQMMVAGIITPELALSIVPKVCEALQFAHDEGILHRDIKPENILVDRKGRVKIADFGLAKLTGEPDTADSLTRTGMAMGTPRYMAPEQYADTKTVDHRADIYSLGVVFYEMLTGELPIGRFAAPSKKVVVDVRLDEVVLRTLEQEPALRYQHASEVKTDVENITRHEPVPSAKGPERPGKSESAFSRRAVAGALCVAVAFVFSVVAFVLVSNVSFYLGLVSHEEPIPSPRFKLLLSILAPWGFALGLAGTSLGWLALRDIRRSSGGLGGFFLAFVAALLFPICILDVLVATFCDQLAYFLGGILEWDYRTKEGLWGLLTLPACAAADVWLVTAAWRRLGSRAPPSDPSSTGKVGPSRIWRRVRVYGVGTLLLGAGVAVAVFAYKSLSAKQDGQTTELNGIAYLEGHTSAVKALGITPAGNALVSAGLDGRLIARDFPGGAIRSQERFSRDRTKPDETAQALRCLSVSPDGSFAFVGGDLGGEILKVGRAQTKKFTLPVDGLATIHKLMGLGADEVAFLSLQDRELIFYHLGGHTVTGRAIIPPGKEGAHVTQAVASPGGKYVAVLFGTLTPSATEPGIFTVAEPCRIQVYDRTGKLCASADERVSALELPGTQMVFTEDEVLLVCLPTGKMRRWILGPPDPRTAVWSADTLIPPARYTACALSPDRTVVWLATENLVMGFHVETGSGMGQVALQIGECPSSPAENPIQALAVGKDGLLAAALRDGRVAVARVQPPGIGTTSPTAAPVPRFQGFRSSENGPELHPDAIQKLKLTGVQTKEINRILKKYRAEAIALERRHTRISKGDQGRTEVTIEPFSEECLELARRMVAEFGGIVDSALLPEPRAGVLPPEVFGLAGECRRSLTLWKNEGGNFCVQERTADWVSAAGQSRYPQSNFMQSNQLADLPENVRTFWPAE